ncbi:SMI1/KNR4 family protein [Nonomuraea sp. NPDC049421]|uniref:SMI1/KNR4 family protein n=1 Tax=Nonomuraea sp. NPDC049421 TaxID=3155275 RepID=UPI00341854EF
MTWSTFFPEKFPPRPPATEADVRALEARLDVELPPSYRRFLLFADGYGDPDDEHCLRSAATVGWLRDLESWFVDYCLPEDHTPRSVPDELYFVYGEGQDCIHIREEYLPDLLLVGHWDDGWVLLNPRVRTAEGEWEAWFHAPWLPGANRYRTFLDLMEDEHRRAWGGVA